jgi:hypothetical protein
MEMIIISTSKRLPSRSGEQAVSDQAFNAVVCRAGPCAGAAGSLLNRLRAATRRCPQGVLVSTGCVLRAACGRRATTAAPT